MFGGGPSPVIIAAGTKFAAVKEKHDITGRHCSIGVCGTQPF